MRIAFIASGARHFGRMLWRRRESPLVPGMLSGASALCWFHQFGATFGASAAVSAGTALVIAATIGISLCIAQSPRSEGRRCLTMGWCHFGIAAWTIGLPFLIRAVEACLGKVSITTFADPGMTFLVGLAAAFALLTAPVACAARLAVAVSSSAANDCRNGLGKFTCGAALGLIAGALWIGPLVGLKVLGFAAAAAQCAIFLNAMMRSAPTRAEPVERVVPVEQEGAEEPVSVRPGRIRLLLVGLCRVIFLGAAAAVAERVVQQLMPTAGFVGIAQWAGLLLGGGCALAWRKARQRTTEDPHRSVRNAGLFAAVWCVALPALFPNWISLHLAVNGTVTWVWLLSLLRATFVAAAFAPLGAAVCLAMRSSGIDGDRPAGRIDGKTPAEAEWLLILGFIAAFLIARTEGIVELGVARLAAICGIGLFLSSGIRLWTFGGLPQRRTRRFATAAAAAIVLVAGIATGHRYAPEISAKLLFSTDVLVARQAGLAWEQFSVLDDARKVGELEGPRGTLTVWRRRGVRYQLRRDGVPVCDVTTRTDVCPHEPAEALQAIVPLVLHDHAYRVLLLGYCGGAPLETCLAFPMQQVTWAIGDREAIAAHREIVWPAASFDPLADKRVRLIAADPALAVAAAAGPFDVIVANPVHAALGCAAAQYTSEYYRRAAGKLAEDGLFCQRFSHVDFGPGPICAVARTMQSAFRHVIAVSVAPGELLFLGSNSNRGLVHDGLLDRLQRDHVRRAFSRIGWDWSVILNVPVFTADTFAAVETPHRWGPNSAANGRLTFALPGELMRWGDKLHAAQTALSQHTKRLLDWDNVDGQDPDVLKRLADVAAQHKLMTNYTDQPWSYRAALREDLETSSRSIIRQVSAVTEEKIHPVDQQRKDYVVALGKAAETGLPDPERLADLQAAAEPYDPLITYFMHHEAAEIYARSDPHDAAGELFHRLYAAYYADPADRSVRNVARALELVAEHPELVPDEAARWDHMNSLMETLKLRWMNRSAAPPNPARIELNDIEKSMSAIEAAFAEMNRLYRAGAVPDTHWPAREQVLEVALVRPLRTYRARLLPHHLKQQRKTQEILRQAREASR